MLVLQVPQNKGFANKPRFCNQQIIREDGQRFNATKYPISIISDINDTTDKVSCKEVCSL
jgi:hypothetical protein